MKTIDIETFREDYGFRSAFHEALFTAYGSADLSCVSRVIAADEGENDERDWIAVAELDGTGWSEGRKKFCVMRAGCDYTGWDCRAGGSIEFHDTEEECLSVLTLTEGERSRLEITAGKDSDRRFPLSNPLRKGERMNTKHTPGPWNDAGYQGELDDDRDIQIGSAAGNVATVCYCGAAYSSGDNDESRFVTRDANASLIAAAPDLLEALQHLVRFHDQLSQSDINHAKHAIRKATGND